MPLDLDFLVGSDLRKLAGCWNYKDFPNKYLMKEYIKKEQNKFLTKELMKKKKEYEPYVIAQFRKIFDIDNPELDKYLSQYDLHPSLTKYSPYIGNLPIVSLPSVSRNLWI